MKDACYSGNPQFYQKLTLKDQICGLHTFIKQQYASDILNNQAYYTTKGI